MDIEERLIAYLREAEEPKNFTEIQEMLDCSIATTKRLLQKLVESGDAIAVGAKNNKKYYIANNESITVGDLSKIKTKSMEMLVPAKAASDDAKEEIESLRREIKSIYANFISIMAVFVTIFSIVFVGANVLFDIAKSGWSWQTISAFLAVEAGVIVGNLVMLFGVKKFLDK